MHQANWRTLPGSLVDSALVSDATFITSHCITDLELPAHLSACHGFSFPLKCSSLASAEHDLSPDSAERNAVQASNPTFVWAARGTAAPDRQQGAILPQEMLHATNSALLLLRLVISLSCNAGNNGGSPAFCRALKSIFRSALSSLSSFRKSSIFPDFYMSILYNK